MIDDDENTEESLLAEMEKEASVPKTPRQLRNEKRRLAQIRRKSELAKIGMPKSRIASIPETGDIIVVPLCGHKFVYEAPGRYVYNCPVCGGPLTDPDA